jgi:hypothetical protein
MKTQAIHTNEMTLQPFLGRRANQTTHNPTGAVSLLPVATTCDQKEVTMKTQAIAPKTGIETSTPNQQPKGQTQMNRISFLIRKLANTAPKAALLAIIAVGSFVLSPMAFAGCSFSPSAVTLYATPGQSVTSSFTISGISESWFSEGWVTAGFFVSGDFTGPDANPYAAYEYPPDTIYPQSPPQKFQLPASSAGYLSVYIPRYAIAGQSVVLQTVVKDWFSYCNATLTVNVVASPGLSTEMNTIGGNNEVDEYYKGTDSHVYRLSWDGAWQYTDITTAAGAPNADYLSPVVSQVDPLYNRSEVFYLDSNQDVHELYYDYGSKNPAWKDSNITLLFKLPSAEAGSPIVSLVNPYANSIQVDYLDSAGHIHEMYSFNRTTWAGNDLTVVAGALPAALNSSLVTEINKVANTVEIYFLGTDSHVRELWWAPWTWHNSDPTAAARAPNAANGSALVSLSNPIAKTVQVDYLDSAGHIHELWWNGTWHTDDLTAATGAPVAATGSSLATEVNTLSNPNTVELYYIAHNQTVQELWFNPTPWVWNYANPSGSAGAPQAVVGSPLVSLVNTRANSVQVHYISTDDHVHELYTWNWTTWYTDDVNNSSNDPNNAEP